VEFASPLYERDNHYSNFDPTTNTMIQATSGSLYDRSLVHPDYKDYGRASAWHTVSTPNGDTERIWDQLYVFQPVGSAEEGINAPQALFGVLSQTIPSGGAVPSTFLTTQNSFTSNIASPAAFNPANSNVVYTPPDSRWPYVQTGSSRCSGNFQGHGFTLSYNGNHSLRLPIIAITMRLPV